MHSIDSSPKPLALRQLYFEHYAGADENAAMKFWREHFAESQPLFFPEPQLSSERAHEFAMHTHYILNSGLENTHSITATLYTAWALLVAKHTGSCDIIFGVSEQHRHSSEGGRTIRTVPLRVTFQWEQTVKVMLNLVHQTVLDMRQFDGATLADISQASIEAKEACRFLTKLSLKNSEKQIATEYRFDATAEAVMNLSSQPALPLDIEFQSCTDGLIMGFHFDTFAIDESRIRQISYQFEHILRQIVAVENDTTKLKELRMVGLSDLESIWKWNETVPEPMDACVHDLISEVTIRQPNAPAVCAWDGELTYKELDELSSQLAMQLSNLGFSSGIIPLCFEKSMWTPVAVMAVMKSGGTSLLLEIRQPETRLQNIVQQVSPTVILTSLANQRLAQELSKNNCSILTVGEEYFSHIENSPASILPVVHPSTPLYLVYTSGSTGTPKGVVVTHYNFRSAVKHQQHVLGFTPSRRVLDFASYAFDMSWYNLLHSLSSGSCLCIPSDHDRKNDIAGCIRRYRISYAFFTPTVARALGEEVLSALDIIVFAGEPALPSDIRLCGPNASVVIVYGPAECTPGSTIARFDGSAKLSAGSNIGTGFGVKTWIVNPAHNNKLSLIGEVGELWLEGPLCGQGYLNDPSQTAQAFADNPEWLLAGGPGYKGRCGRLYKTGDLVRYNSNGSLTYIGRKDTQVKIRGQRVELGEVEHHVKNALTNCLQHSTAEHRINMRVVAEVVTPHGSEISALVAFICMNEGDAIDFADDSWDDFVRTRIAGIEDYLVNNMPLYMIPVAYFPLKNLPMTATGKADRRRLRELGAARFHDGGDHRVQARHVSPTSDLESEIQHVWAEVLNFPVEAISVDIAFTRLGGDSISAMQVVSRCRSRNICVTVGDVLRSKTISSLSLCCRLTKKVSNEAEAVVEEMAWQLSPIQKSFFAAHPDGLNHYNQSFMLKFASPVPASVVGSALQTVVRRHPMLRARFLKLDDRWQQYVSTSTNCSFEFAEHMQVNRSDVKALAQSRQGSLDIVNGPVFAADLFQVVGESQALLLTAHHLVIDLVSWRIIWHDIERQFMQGDMLSLEPISFQKWCQLQQEFSCALRPSQALPVSTVASEFDYWGVSLTDNTTNQSETHRFNLDETTTALLLGASNMCLTSEPVDIVLGALVHSFCHTFSDRQVPPVFLEGHGREPFDGSELDLSETVGWFTTLHPVQISLRSDNTVYDAIKFAKDTRNQTPSKGLLYYACRYNSPEGQKKFESHNETEILFNYMGRYQQLEKSGSILQLDDRADMVSELRDTSLKAQRMALVEINAVVLRDKMEVSIFTHRGMLHQTKLRQWVTLFEEVLISVVHSLPAKASMLTLSDFPLLHTSYRGLDTLIAQTLPAIGIDINEVQDIYPCTAIQEGILLSRGKGTAAYANHWVWKCIANDDIEILSPSRLESAWRTVTSQHAVFSTILVEDEINGGFVQVLLRSPSHAIKWVSSNLDCASDTLLNLSKRQFLPGQPEWALTICAAPDGTCACRLDISHALIDASSIQIVLEDLVRSYNGLKLPSAPPPRNMIQYLDRINKTESLEFWRNYLHGAPRCNLPVLQLSGKPTLEEGSYGIITLSTEAAECVASLCKQLDITRSTLLQLVWSFVLSQYTGLNDVCFGYMASGRDIPISGIERMVGAIINILIARIDLTQSLEDILCMISEQTSEHLKFQHSSLAEIQHELRLGVNQLFNTALTVVDASSTGSFSGLEFKEAGSEDSHEVISPLLHKALR
jgi:amino acid adenylation domain-containing protein/non-ribosomal peptide synthase protein (TIGR01720 family)